MAGGARGGATVAIVDALGVGYVHDDHLGTPQVMTDRSAAVVWDASYRPFGEATIAGAAANEQRFPGQTADAETGWHDNWHRTYDPSLGRYLQSDPIGIMAGFNTYGYAGGNPVMRFDRMGLDWRDNAWKYAAFAGGAVAVAVFTPGLVTAAVVGFTVGQVIGAVGIITVQYSTGGWCNVDKNMVWFLVEEGLWGLAGGVFVKAVKVGYGAWKAGRRGAPIFTRGGGGLQYRGGPYGKLDSVPGIERHHMPADSVSPISRHKGPAIQMDSADHALTSSYRNSNAAKQYRNEVQELINEGRMRDAMAKEIRDVRRVAGGKYNKAIGEMLDYAKGAGYFE